MFVCCVLSGRGLWDELITRPEESYRLWRVVVYDQETSWTRGPYPALGCRTRENNNNNNNINSGILPWFVTQHTSIPRWKFGWHYHYTLWSTCNLCRCILECYLSSLFSNRPTI
jgi:hypothetical protein